MTSTLSSPDSCKERSVYMRTLLVNYINAIFTAYNKEQADILYRLIQDNTRAFLREGVIVYPSFMYNGEIFPYSPNRGTNKYNRLIHPTMMKQITEFMNKKNFDMIQQRQRIEGYIINVLLFAKHINDILELIPDKFNREVSLVTAHINVGPPATVDEIQTFRDANIVGLTEFKRMFLEDLLMT